MDESCQALAVASDRNDVGEAAQRKIEDFDQVLARYCLQTLDAGAGAAVVAGWMAEGPRRAAPDRGGTRRGPVHVDGLTAVPEFGRSRH
jgi:hypothetical protein